MSNTFANKFLCSLKILFLVFTLIAIANLFIELLAVARSYFPIVSSGKGILKKIYPTSDSDLGFLEQHSRDIFEGDKKRYYMYSVGPVRDFSSAVSFSGASDGRRITPIESLNGKKYQGVMFGASQSWGYFVDDKHLVSQLLMNKMKDVAIDNYSLLGVTFEQIISYWHVVKPHLGEKKFVVVVGGVADIMMYCYSEPYAFKQKAQVKDKIGFVYFYSKLVTKLTHSEEPAYCNSKTDIDNVVQRVMNSIESILLLAKKNNVKALVVIPPVPFFGSSNTSNFPSNNAFLEMKKTISPAYEALNTRINDLDSASVINLMDAFDDGNIYFLDSTGHFTERGHEKLAEEIINQVGEEFFKSS